MSLFTLGFVTGALQVPYNLQEVAKNPISTCFISGVYGLLCGVIADVGGELFPDEIQWVPKAILSTGIGYSACTLMYKTAYYKYKKHK